MDGIRKYYINQSMPDSESQGLQFFYHIQILDFNFPVCVYVWVQVMKLRNGPWKGKKRNPEGSEESREVTEHRWHKSGMETTLRRAGTSKEGRDLRGWGGGSTKAREV